VAIKYEQVVEQFNIPNMLDRRLASIRSSNRKLYSASSKRVACSPTASLATISETWSSASPATVTTPTRSANLLFGTPIDPVFEGDGLARNAYVQSLLDRVGLTRDLVEVGTQVARIMVELLAGLQPENEFFEELGLITAEDLPVFERILTQIEKSGVDGLAPEEKARFASLAFNWSPRATRSASSTRVCNSESWRC